MGPRRRGRTTGVAWCDPTFRVGRWRRVGRPGRHRVRPAPGLNGPSTAYRRNSALRQNGPVARLAWDTLLRLDGAGPLHQRLESALRQAIRSGRLATGSALPPSRVLAGELGCSRWAVTEAYGQLVAEGYLRAQVGSATRVHWTPDRDSRKTPP